MRALALGILFTMAALAGCQKEATTPSATADAAQLPADQVIYGLQHVMTDAGVRTAVLNSDTAYLQEEGERFDLVGVRLRFYDENGRESGHLTSKTGEYNVRGGAFVARGNAVLITQGENGPRELETEELHYDVESGELWSDVPFVLRESGRTTRGSSFRSDARFRTWTVSGATTEGGLQSGDSELSF
jgi:LPS export ABC transporter protein LptC